MGITSSFDLDRRVWDAVSYGAAGLAAFGALYALRRGWTLARGEPPPADPEAEVSWTTALGWAVATGIVSGLARLAGRRGAASAWRMVADRPPPERA